ncbi:MAG: NUDIX hydrolase [Candidatus Liptonbacteria bacterium]
MAIIPWQKVGGPKVLAEGYRKRLDVQKFKDHKGREVDFYFIERPFWSVILPITKDGEVLMIRQFKQGSETIMEELPAGVADFPSETPEQVIQRELEEETGYVAQKVISLGSCHYDSGSSHAKFYCFLATGCEHNGRTELDETEQIELVKVPFIDWAKEILKARTDEWDAVVLFLRALPHLGVDVFDIIKSHLPTKFQ